MAPFQNIMNEFYPKEISKKVRQVKRAWAMEGAFMGSQAPYGYQKSPEDKHKLIVDEAAARVIRDIFQRLLDGDSARCIAEQLNARGTDTPSVYQYRRNGKLPPENRDNLWSSELIISLARNPVYLGHMIQCKRENVSFKSKQRKVVPEEDWVRVNNTHEPLIDQQEWDKMQLNIAERRVVRRSNNQEVSLFAGLLRCSECGKKLVSSMKTQKKVPKRIYKCSTYNQKGEQACSSHWITEDYILKILKDDLAFYAGHLRDNEDAFTQAFVELSNQNKSENILEQREKLRHLEQRRSLIEDVIKKLIEENCEGNITATALNSIIGKYYQEENELHSEIVALTKQIDLWEDQLIDIQQWIAALQSYNPDQLGRKEVLQLIHKIIVREKDPEEQGNRIEIHYLHVGAIDKLALVL